MSKFPKNLQNKLSKRHGENAYRKLNSKSVLVDFSSNDYLGLSREKAILESAMELMALEQNHQNGATGSRLLTGNHNLYYELEKYLSAYYNSESALVFNSGYDANLGFFSTVPQRGDLILFDELCHASIRDGIQLGKAKAHKFKHNNVDDLCYHIERSRNTDNNTEIYVITESVFSMDGDSPNLNELATLCEAQKVHLVVDEAHALGVFGKGLVGEQGLEGKVFARIITFGKALGVHGAAVLGSEDLKAFLINFCRSLIYTTGLPPHTLATVLAAYSFLEGKQGIRLSKKLGDNILYFKQMVRENGLNPHFIESGSAIQVCKIGHTDKVKLLSSSLRESGFDVRPILSPTVPKGSERLRLCIHAFNTEEEIQQVVEVVTKNILQ